MSGIYLHIPFCKQACHYCDFHFSTSMRRKEEMLNAMVREIGMRKNEFAIADQPKSAAETIYFGGGTPSLLEPHEIEQIIACIQENFDIHSEAEITLEVNPDDLEKARIEELANTPVNRLSLGIQSFRDEDLEFMNRAHNRDQALTSLETACNFFENISIDLIYGIPGLDLKAWKANLKQAFEFPIQHISSYALTVEPKTALDHFIRTGKCEAPDEEEARIHFEALMEESAKQGFTHYEVSNFAREGFFSRHNTSYWQGKPYLGIGPSAHSYSGRTRSWNVNNNAKYLKGVEMGHLVREVENLSEIDRINETIMTGLRTIWGLSLGSFEKEFGSNYAKKLKKRADRFVSEGLLEVESERLRATKAGFFLVDGIASDLFVD